MKHAKKLASLLLVLVMVLSLATTAFAVQQGTLTGGSITINDAVPGQIYKAYQILYLESYNKDSGAYAYKANSAWETWLRTQTSYVSFDTQGYVTWVEGADAAAFAKLAQVEAAKMAADATATAAAAAEGATYSTVKFENLKLGYYLVDTTLGTLCSLNTTNPHVVMEEKNEVPANVKTVEEDSTGNYGDKNDADIGQTVNFKSTITAQAGAENYVFHDTMSAGLTYTGVTGITLNGTTVDASKYTVVTEGLTDGCTFEVRFTQTFCDTLNANDQIVISYTATLNENAVIAGEGNPNTSKVSYGDSSNTKYTPDSQTRTYTWDFNIFKYTKNASGKEVALSGAKFKLSKDEVGTQTISLIDITAENATTKTYRVAKTGETGITEFEVGSDGKVVVQGLDADTYYLTETVAPAGYNKLAGAIKVTIDSEGNVKKDNDTDALVNKTLKVENKTGALLPSTGGMGTTIFYVLGSVLVLAAVVLLVTKKRMNAAER